MSSTKGDTIVEVLIAIAIASFTIGITYSTASRSLNQSISAREHNQALNYLQNQVTDLKLRFQKSSSPTVFNSYFGSPKNHFCLDDTAVTPSTTTPWTPYSNSSTTSESSPLTGGGSPYNNSCVKAKPGDGTTYYIDIETSSLSGITQNPTVYHIFVRWTSGTGFNQASVYYRINGPSGQVLGLNLPNSSGGFYVHQGKQNES